jgi:hypothetical protein
MIDQNQAISGREAVRFSYSQPISLAVLVDAPIVGVGIAGEAGSGAA